MRRIGGRRRLGEGGAGAGPRVGVRRRAGDSSSRVERHAGWRAGGSGEPGAVDLAVEMGPCLAACDRGEQRAEDDPGERDQRGVLSAPSSTGMRGRLSWLKTLY